MAADEIVFKPGDTDNNLLRKILMSLNGEGTPVSGGSAALTDTQLRANPVPVVTGLGLLRNLQVAFQRPADSTAYAASDVVGPNVAAVQAFSNAAVANGGSGYVTKARLTTDVAVTTLANFRLYLFSVAPTAIADNSPFTLLYANRLVRVGYIDFALGTEGTGSDCAEAVATGLLIPFKCAVTDTALYGVLVAKAAYVPGNAENFALELTVDVS